MVNSLVASQYVEQGGLAGARRAQDGSELARPEQARYGAQDDLGACEPQGEGGVSGVQCGAVRCSV